MGGYAAPNTFRKTYQKNALKPKFETIIRTTEDIEADERRAVGEDKEMSEDEEDLKP